MCGIAGFLDGRRFAPEEAAAIIRRMADTVAHRGPDDGGVWLDSNLGIALAHRRLAVIDPSPAGRQPMQSMSGRHVIVFNGEIYNYRDLRHRLEIQWPKTCSWRGHSDTETLLAAIDCWGLEKALQAAIGMFAFALWDRADRTLYLVRDRLGEKPLYYGWQNGVFLFGSEIKALAAHPAFGGDIDRDAIHLLLRNGYIPSPWSIYEGVRKLPAGTYVEVPAGGLQERIGEIPEPQRYWSLQTVVATGRARPFEGTPQDAVDTLHGVLFKAVGQQMFSDVPLGAFLSGGIDSSIIVALMQAQSDRPVRTFTIGFDEPGYNEAEYARAVADHLGTEHTEMYVSGRDALDLLPRLPTLFDEPFADPSQIPTFFVASLGRTCVTVALSGDGGDELFGGYAQYLRTVRLWHVLSRIPSTLRRLSVSAIGHLCFLGPDRLLGDRWFPAKAKVSKLRRLMDCRTLEEVHSCLISRWPSPSLVGRGGCEPAALVSESASWPIATEPMNRLMALDMLGFLPDDILVKVDRAAMGVSLETRLPFLDHRVVKFAWRLPMSVKLRHGQQKWVLRQVLSQYLPKPLFERPKTAFLPPLTSWLLGPLRDWAEALLDESRLQAEGFFDPQLVRREWKMILETGGTWSARIWIILMFQAWLDNSRQSG